MIPTDTPTSVRWPASRFYWAVLDGLGWSRPGPLPPGLLDTLAYELPVPTEEVHAVGLPLGDGRILVCACPRDALASLDPTLIELRPESPPDGFAGGIDPDQCNLLNLLSGAFEPAPIRAARRSRHLHLRTTCLLCALAVSAGLWRRAAHANAAAARAGTNAKTLLADLTPPNSDRREETLGLQVRAMQAIVDVAARTKPPADAAAGFESLLKCWPTEVPCKPQSVSVSADGVSLGVVVEGDAAPFLHAFRPPAGFTLDEPRLTTVGPITRLALHLRTLGGGTHP